eukprot:8839255-Pyramimonas_sp.AAC.1
MQWGCPKKLCYPLNGPKLASWNVEGLGHDMAKLPELQYHMKQHNISILCIQETGITESTHFVDSGFLVILAGTSVETTGRFYSGVGFLIAPWAIKAV